MLVWLLASPWVAHAVEFRVIGYAYDNEPYGSLSAACHQGLLHNDANANYNRVFHVSELFIETNYYRCRWNSRGRTPPPWGG